MEVIAFIGIIYGIFLIILLFKIWGMTNNVSFIASSIQQSLKKEIKSESLYYAVVRLEMTGKHDAAIQLLLSRMNDKLTYLIDKKRLNNYDSDKLQKEWEKTIDGCKSCFEYLNIEIPEYYQSFNFETYADTVSKLKS